LAARKIADEEIASAKAAGRDYSKLADNRIADEKKYDDYLRSREAERSRIILSPLQKLEKGWENTAQNIESLEASWANKMMGGLDSIATGGVKDWETLRTGVNNIMVGMLQDVSKMITQKAMSGVVGGVSNAIGNGAKSLMGSIFSQAPASGGAGAGGAGKPPAQTNMFSDLIGKAGTGLKSFWSSITGADKATKDMTGSVGQTVVQTGEKILQGSVELTTEEQNNLAMIGLAFYANAAAAALAQVAAQGTAKTVGSVAAAAAATGGISGPNSLVPILGRASIPFHAYAKGGVANSPQLSLFGEAGPEAYVPLPDGRSIPVTMQAGKQSTSVSGGETVNISIVVNEAAGTGSGQDQTKQTTAGDAGAVWSTMANKIKVVVREEMVTQRRPGGLLYN
jgi:hypothetical protein